ncbi:thioesterase II family protein [Nocardiopsis deserti]|uniref:thioesterase II family protein n=1 Tax=Nocardiopsis deserti TaxID=2605988 RepID=UPI00123C6F28|nr:alpha/beta fold hydrolase [Nocardiopsis deserti]
MPTTTDTTWLRRYHSAPEAAARLVCFPYAGGAASFYHPVSAALAPDVDVLALQLPGRQDRRGDPCVDDLATMADLVADVLRGHTDLPLGFFGHSMGAVLAFEVARRLVEAGGGPDFLMVSGRRAPSRRRPGRVHLMDDEGLVDELRRNGATDPRVLDDEELRHMVLRSVRNDYRAIETYVCDEGAVVPCPVHVLTGQSDPQTTLDEARAWEEHTESTCTVQEFSGGHFFLTGHVETINGLIRDAFTKSGRAAGATVPDRGPSAPRRL